MMPLKKLSNDMQDAGGVQCDSTFVCPADMSCCKGPQGQWSCCPFRLVCSNTDLKNQTKKQPRLRCCFMI